MMLYDVQTQRNALETSRRIADQGWAADASNFPYLVNSFMNWEIRLNHITTSMNGCSSIRKNGLLCFSESLKINSEIASMLNAAQISYSDGCFYKNSGESRAPIQSDLLRGIHREDCVNAFLFHSDQMDEYDKSPDVLRKIAHSNVPRMKKVLICWEKEACPYEVLFSVSPQDIDVIARYYASTEDTIEDLARALIEICSDIAEGRPPAHGVLPVALKRQVKIPPCKLTIQPLVKNGSQQSHPN